MLLWIYLIFKLMVHVTEGLVIGHIGRTIDFFTESGAPWYLLSMSLWYLTIPVVSQLNKRAVLTGAVIIALLAGYQNSVGDFMSMSRTLAFGPFFYAGYYLNESTVRQYLGSKFKWKVAALAAVISLILLTGAYDYWKPYTFIFFGSGYQKAGGLYAYGALLRGFWYVVSFTLCFGLMAVIPKKRNRFSVIGERTLQIYILHRLFRDLAQYFGFYLVIDVHSKVQVLGVIVLGIILTIALGNRCFKKGFDWICRLPFGNSYF